VYDETREILTLILALPWWTFSYRTNWYTYWLSLEKSLTTVVK